MPRTTYDESVQRAAHLLSQARLPLISGLRTDIAGIVAAVRLAESLGGAIDHVAAQSSLNEQGVLSDIGLMLVTPAAAHRDCDTLLLVGARPFPAGLDIDAMLQEAPHPRKQLRRIVSLGSGGVNARDTRHEVFSVASDAFGIAGPLAAVRACLNGRPLVRDFDASEVARCVEVLAAASYGVALWQSDEIEPLELEMLAGLIKDLNLKTRWSGLPFFADPTVVGATMALGWMAGFPPRIGFARGYAAHDPWQFETRRLVKSGEADVVVWISAFGDDVPGWLDRVPAILLASPSPPGGSTAILFPVGCPGRDHDAILYDSGTAALVEKPALSPSGLPTVSAVLTDIREALPAP